ncbi:unnamed protein product [Bursaphelenchus okinawaensis]|uniref:Uncharacterized protein n=1 Tax=Bursaphelenchus okinawaensis TaxID=465554 RepID=A0A811KHU3_9BILA|nr:unnamed protein product [Bursaphelenchus okinawaensis]CAG9103524.1 unnamed protein product [Bursaphelenchus okinawaensis]
MTQYNLAVLFGAEQMVELLTPKLNEMRPGSHLILCRFPLAEEQLDKNWKILDSEGEGIDAAWLYRRNTTM